MIPPDLGAAEFLRDEPLLNELILGPDYFRSLAAGMGYEDAAFCDSRRITLDFEPRFNNFSKFNQLCVSAENISSIELLTALTLVHGADSGAGAPTSFSGGREKLLPGEVRDIFFPMECFGIYGFPSGWSNIVRIRLGFFPERGIRPAMPICVVIHSLSCQSRGIPKGPRLTDKGLLKQLESGMRLDRSISAAQSACSKFVRACGAKVAPPHSYPRNPPDEIIQGRIMGQNPGKPVNWNFNPLGSLEWTHFLNRHHFLADLVTELITTHETKYVEAIDSFIEDWITANPVPLSSNGGAGPAWETLSVAWRLREWMWVVGTAWEHESFRDRTKSMMLASIWEHCTSLRHHKGHPNNWLIVESCSLLSAAMCFREFKDSGEWLSQGIAYLAGELKRQFFEDGVHFEISPFYHAICLHAVMEVKICADLTGTPLPWQPDQFLEKGFDYLAALCRPDFTWPSINDSGSAVSDYSDLMLMAAKTLNRDDFLWIGSSGTHGRPPLETFHSFPDAGIAVMRSHFGSDANYLMFRAGPSGAAHVHGDRLSLDVATNGVPRLADPGISTYAPGEITDYYRSAAAHNMILLDNKGPDSSPDFYLPDPKDKKDSCFGNSLGRAAGSVDSSESRIKPAGDKFSARTEGKIVSGFWEDDKQGCVVARSVHFINDSFWIVHDGIYGNGVHEITVCWNFYPNCLDAIGKDLVMRIGDPRAGDFDIVPLLGEFRPIIQRGTGRLMAEDSFRNTRKTRFLWRAQHPDLSGGNFRLFQMLTEAAVKIKSRFRCKWLPSKKAETVGRSDKPKPTMGWVSLSGMDVPAPSARYTIKAHLPAGLIWILIPAGQRAGMDFRREDSEGSIRVVIKHTSGKRETVHFNLSQGERG